MRYAIVYSSKTGNTAQLARCIGGLLPAEDLLYCGAPAAEAAQADLLFVGSWTDKGTCCPEIAQFLGGLHGKQVYLFGTAGFGGAPAYFAQIGARMAENLSADNDLRGTFLCQGRMPQAVRARYEALAQTDPQKAQPMLENFDRALSHPDQADLDALARDVSALLDRLRAN